MTEKLTHPPSPYQKNKTVDLLLDEATLEGGPLYSASNGRPHDALRTSALNMLSELVSPLREKLTTQQVTHPPTHP